MKQQDYEFLIENWKQLVESLQEVNESLRNLTIAQHETILRLQGIQTVTPIEPVGETE